MINHGPICAWKNEDGDFQVFCMMLLLFDIYGMIVAYKVTKIQGVGLGVWEAELAQETFVLGIKNKVTVHLMAAPGIVNKVPRQKWPLRIDYTKTNLFSQGFLKLYSLVFWRVSISIVQKKKIWDQMTVGHVAYYTLLEIPYLC
jgi:hypothetical protein